MQLAMSVATGKAFLNGSHHPGFSVKKTQKTVVIAGEDTLGGIAHRFLGSIASGHLPTARAKDDVLIITDEDLEKLRMAKPNAPGLALFEAQVEKWYQRGYRVIAIDPLRVLEAVLGIENYPGTTGSTGAHARDFNTMRYYTRLAQRYEDLCLLVSMHHGKNKKEHDASDPGDMIAGTTGFGAAAITTISLLPIPEQVEADEIAGKVAKRRELYVHGRYTREARYLIEQSVTTGVWSTVGAMKDELANQVRSKYFDAMLSLGGRDKWISAESIAAACRVSRTAVHKVLQRARKGTYLGWRVVIKRGESGGYKLVR
jgi:biotin operon repressor